MRHRTGRLLENRVKPLLLRNYGRMLCEGVLLRVRQTTIDDEQRGTFASKSERIQQRNRTREE